jgi:hypothetical protein
MDYSYSCPIRETQLSERDRLLARIRRVDYYRGDSAPVRQRLTDLEKLMKLHEQAGCPQCAASLEETLGELIDSSL